jgi:MFS family permease
MLQTWLIVARAIQGIGGGGIIQLVSIFIFYKRRRIRIYSFQVNITISDIVPLEEYGVFASSLPFAYLE